MHPDRRSAQSRHVRSNYAARVLDNGKEYYPDCCVSTGKAGRRRDVLDVSHFHGASFPGAQNLADPLTKHSIARCNRCATPTKNEIKLDNPTLQIWTIMPFEHRYLARECDQIIANCYAQLIRPQALKLHFVERRERSAARAGIFLAQRTYEKISICRSARTSYNI
jgi:hypothetical protein